MPVWRPMVAADLPTVMNIAARVHVDYPEREAVFAERLALFPAGCAMLGAVGYAIAHPGVIGAPPPLDHLMGTLPRRPDCLYLHDLAILGEYRGGGHGRALSQRLCRLARSEGLPRLALIAVNHSEAVWRRLGFVAQVGGEALSAKLRSYGGDAVYMVRDL